MWIKLKTGDKGDLIGKKVGNGDVPGKVGKVIKIKSLWIEQMSTEREERLKYVARS